MENNGVTPDGVTRLGNAIVAIVGEEFERTQRVVLLSNLGQDLRKAGVDYRAVLGKRRFAEFIATDLADRVTLVDVPGKNQTVAIYPAEVDLATKNDPFGPPPLVVEVGIPVRAAQNRRQQLHSQVWFAFSHFLAEGYTRLLELTPEPRYQDVQSDAGLPDGTHRIGVSQIVAVGTMPKAERDARIYQNIELWAREEGIPLDALVAKTSERDGQRSLLDEIIRTIGPSDLARFNLPLDIVKALRDRRF